MRRKRVKTGEHSAEEESQPEEIDDEQLLNALNFFSTRTVELPGRVISTAPVTEVHEIHGDTHLPLGLKLWRNLRLGFCLEEALEDFSEIFNATQTEALLRAFDLAAHKMFMRFRSKAPKFRIVDGFIQQYKNIEGTWILFIKNLRFRDKRRVFYSPMTKIVATEKFALEYAAKQAEKKATEKFTAAELFFDGNV